LFLEILLLRLDITQFLSNKIFIIGDDIKSCPNNATNIIAVSGTAKNTYIKIVTLHFRLHRY